MRIGKPTLPLSLITTSNIIWATETGEKIIIQEHKKRKTGKPSTNQF